MREMETRWGLRQLEKGQRNSRVHAMQPTKAEKEMRTRGAAPDKDIMRECLTRRVREIAQEAPEGNRTRELALRLKADGAEMVASKNATYGERSRAAYGDPLREPRSRRTARSPEPPRRGTAARAQRAVMPTYGEASNGARSESEANAERVSPLRGGETSA